MFNPRTITARGNASGFRGWKVIAFYDGATKLGEVTAASAPRFTAKDLTPGFQVFSILPTDGDGMVPTADPKFVIVKPLKDKKVRNDARPGRRFGFQSSSRQLPQVWSFRQSINNHVNRSFRRDDRSVLSTLQVSVLVPPEPR